jgi:hypothetical protein
MKLNYKQKLYIWAITWIATLINWVAFIKLFVGTIYLLPFVISFGICFAILVSISPFQNNKLLDELEENKK